MNLGHRLKAARLAKNLTQEQLSEISGVKQGTISKIERGDQEHSTYVVDLAIALDVDPAYLQSGISGKTASGEKIREPGAVYFAEDLPPDIRAMWNQLSDSKRRLILDMIASLAEVR